MRGSSKKRKKTQGHGQQCGDCGAEGWDEVGEGRRGINGNREQTIKN